MCLRYKETISVEADVATSVYFENHMKRLSTFPGQNVVIS
jgi:hypothetical protein